MSPFLHDQAPIGPRCCLAHSGLREEALDSCRYLLAVRPISAQHRAERRPTTLDERFAAKLRKLDRRRR